MVLLADVVREKVLSLWTLDDVSTKHFNDPAAKEFLGFQVAGMTDEDLDHATFGGSFDPRAYSRMIKTNKWWDHGPYRPWIDFWWIS